MYSLVYMYQSYEHISSNKQTVLYLYYDIIKMLIFIDSFTCVSLFSAFY
jgi:hypothetical protein